MSYKQWSRKFIAVNMLLVLCMSFFVATLSPFQVSAQETPAPAPAPAIKSPAEKMKIYEAASYFVVCVQKTGLIKEVSQGDITEGRVTGSRPNSINHQLSIGYLLDNDDGRLKCLTKEDQKVALDALGMDGKELYVSSGVYKAKGDATGYEVAEGDDTAASKLIADYIAKKFGVTVQSTSPSKGFQFFNLQATFLKECKAGEDNTGGKEVKTLDDKGDIVTGKKYSLVGDLGKNFPVGFGMDSPAEEEMNCNDIISRMNSAEYIDEASKLMKDFISKGGKPVDPGGTNQPAAPTCESNSGMSMGWLLCAILDTADGILLGKGQTGGLLGIVDSLLSVDDSLYNNDSLKTTWSYFRNVATFLLILVGLVMIIGQAISKE